MKDHRRLKKIAKGVIIFVVIVLIICSALIIIGNRKDKQNRTTAMMDDRSKYIESLLKSAKTQEDFDQIEDIITEENYIPVDKYFNMGENGYLYLKKLFKENFNYVEIQPLYIQPVVAIYVEDMFAENGLDGKGLSSCQYIVQLKDILLSLSDTDYCHTRIKLMDEQNEVTIEWNINTEEVDRDKQFLVIPYTIDEKSLKSCIESLDNTIKVVNGKEYTLKDLNEDVKRYPESDVSSILLKTILEHITDTDNFRINILSNSDDIFDTCRFCVTVYTQSDIAYIQKNVKSTNKVSEQFSYLYKSKCCSEGFLSKVMQLIR